MRASSSATGRVRPLIMPPPCSAARAAAAPRMPAWARSSCVGAETALAGLSSRSSGTPPTGACSSMGSCGTNAAIVATFTPAAARAGEAESICISAQTAWALAALWYSLP